MIVESESKEAAPIVLARPLALQNR